MDIDDDSTDEDDDTPNDNDDDSTDDVDDIDDDDYNYTISEGYYDEIILLHPVTYSSNGQELNEPVLEQPENRFNFSYIYLVHPGSKYYNQFQFH